MQGQIPRLFPEIRLSDLSSSEALLKILTSPLLDKVARYFGVQTDWLEGEDEYIYEHISCYKQPKIILEDLKNIKIEALGFPLRVLVSDKNLDYRDDRSQSLVVILVEPITVLGDKHINRYKVYCDGWDWEYQPCRIELKAMARLVYKELGMPVSLIKVPPEILEKIGNLKMIPHQFCNAGLNSSPSLEDFALSKEETGIARECDELPEVLEYIRKNQLEGILLSHQPHPKKPENIAVKASDQSEQARKAAIKKNQPGNELKDKFIQYYVAGNFKNVSEAARKFYDSLSESQAILLCRSENDFLKSTPDELRIRAVRTLGNAFSKAKKA